MYFVVSRIQNPTVCRYYLYHIIKCCILNTNTVQSTQINFSFLFNTEYFHFAVFREENSIELYVYEFDGLTLITSVIFSIGSEYSHMWKIHHKQLIDSCFNHKPEFTSIYFQKHEVINLNGEKINKIYMYIAYGHAAHFSSSITINISNGWYVF